MAVELAEMVSWLRSELTEALHAGADAELRFELGPVELELSVVVDKEAKPGAKVRFWVVEAGTDLRAASTTTQKIKLTLEAKRAGTRPLISGDEVVGER